MYERLLKLFITILYINGFLDYGIEIVYRYSFVKLQNNTILATKLRMY
jgi:hypothetical protein